MSGRAPKAKGNRIEREIVRMAKDQGWESMRAWSSDGRSLGWHEEVDVILWKGKDRKNAWRFQVKGRKAIADYIKPCDYVDGQILKEDRKDPLIVVDLQWFLYLLKEKEDEYVKESKV